MTALFLLLLTVGAGENALACADLNGDGHADLLVADEQSARLTVWHGDGHGELLRDSIVNVAANPTDLAVADVNADDHLDVLIAHHEIDQISVLLSDGQGAWTKHTTFTPGVKPHPHVLRLADINQDGHPDVLVDDRAGGGLRWFAGDGNGTFEPLGELIDLGGDPYLGFAVGDLNADGLPDVAAPVAGRTIIAVQGESLSFEITRLGRSTNMFATALLDSNGDGKLDVIAANSERAAAQRFLGDGKGSFRPTEETPHLTAGAKKIAIGDLDGDGSQEAVIVSWSGGVTVIAHGKTFSTTAYDAIAHPWGIAVCDLNNDGADDVVLTDGESAQAGVYLSKPK